MGKWIQITIVSEEEPAPATEEVTPADTLDDEGMPAVTSSATGVNRWLAIGGSLMMLGLVAVVAWFIMSRSGRPAPPVAAISPGQAAPMPASQLAPQVTPQSGNAVLAATPEPLSEDVIRRLASDKQLALVNDEPITEAMLEREVSIGRVLYPLLRGIPVSSDPETLERMRADMLSSIIDERLLVQAAQEAGITISDAELETRISNLLDRTGLSREELADRLAAVGVSLDDLQASLRSTMLAERFVSQNPPPADVTARSAYAAWVKVLQKQGDIQILTEESAIKTVKIGQPAPDFTLRGPKGETVRLADFIGNPLLINFWATWCPPCRFEMPLFEETYQRLKDDGFTVLAVDVQEGPELVNPYVEQMGLTFPIALDRGGAVANAYRVAALPTTVFVDANGIVTDIHRGALVESRLQRYLNGILTRKGE